MRNQRSVLTPLFSHLRMLVLVTWEGLRKERTAYFQTLGVFFLLLKKKNPFLISPYIRVLVTISHTDFKVL